MPVVTKVLRLLWVVGHFCTPLVLAVIAELLFWKPHNKENKQQVYGTEKENVPRSSSCDCTDSHSYRCSPSRSIGEGERHEGN